MLIPIDFRAMSDADLRKLSSAVWEERERRITLNLANGKYPKPESLSNGVEDIKVYRQKHGMSLIEAKFVVDYYRRATK